MLCRFNLHGLINESELDQQLASVYKILVLHSQTLEAQKEQIDVLNRKVQEIDVLRTRVTELESWRQNTVKQLRTIEDRADQDRFETNKIRERVQAIEQTLERLDPLEKRVGEAEIKLEIVAADFEQLRADAKDALTLSSTVNFFKTELMELQEDVTQVLHQAPQTERLMAQVQQNVESSTQQLSSVASKTAYMEASLSKIQGAVGEVRALKQEMNGRLEALESPKVDRMGALEQASRGHAKQIQVLQLNWMNNWGAHEESMARLEDKLMQHVTRLETEVSKGGFGDARVEKGAGGVSLVRLDEEEKRQLRQSLESQQRALSKLETSKADAALVMRLLDSKADSESLVRLDAVLTQLAEDKVDRAELRALSGANAVDNVWPAAVASPAPSGDTPAAPASPARPGAPGSGVGGGSTASGPARGDGPGQGNALPQTPVSALHQLPPMADFGATTASAHHRPPGGGKMARITEAQRAQSQSPQQQQGSTPVYLRRLATTQPAPLATGALPERKPLRASPGSKAVSGGKARPSTAPSLPGQPGVFILGSSPSSADMRRSKPSTPDLTPTILSMAASPSQQAVAPGRGRHL